MSGEDIGHDVLDPGQIGPGGEWLRDKFAPAAGGFFKGIGKGIKNLASTPTGGLVLGGFSALLAFPLIQNWTSNLFGKFNMMPKWAGGLLSTGLGLLVAFGLGDAVTKWGANQGVSKDGKNDQQTSSINGSNALVADEASQEVAQELRQSVRSELSGNQDFRAALARDLRETDRGQGMDSREISEAVDEIIELAATGAGDNFLNLLSEYDLTLDKRADGTIDIKGDLDRLAEDAKEWDKLGAEQRKTLLAHIDQGGRQDGELRSAFREKSWMTAANIPEDNGSYAADNRLNQNNEENIDKSKVTEEIKMER